MGDVEYAQVRENQAESCCKERKNRPQDEPNHGLLERHVEPFNQAEADGELNNADVDPSQVCDGYSPSCQG